MFAKFENYSIENVSKNINHPVMLKSSDGFLKIFLLSKYDLSLFRYRSDSALLLRSVIFTMQYLLIFGYIFIAIAESNPSPVLAFNIFLNYLKQNTFSCLTTYLGSCSVVYWNLSIKFGSQWKYCADLYNKIFIDGIGNDDGNDILYKKVTLALDLLATDLWHHKSFCKLFAYSLGVALDFVYKNNANETFGKITLNKNLTHSSQAFNNGNYDTNTAMLLLSNFQNSLERAFLENS